MEQTVIGRTIIGSSSKKDIHKEDMARHPKSDIHMDRFDAQSSVRVFHEHDINYNLLVRRRPLNTTALECSFLSGS